MPKEYDVDFDHPGRGPVPAASEFLIRRPIRETRACAVDYCRSVIQAKSGDPPPPPPPPLPPSPPPLMLISAVKG